MPLTFDHMLTKIIINTTAGKGISPSDLAGMSVSIKGMLTKATFDLETGNMSAFDIESTASITPATITDGSQYEAIVLSTEYPAEHIEFTFTVKGKEYVWKTPTIHESEFMPGKKYIYNMTIAKADITFICTINNWDAINREGEAN